MPTDLTAWASDNESGEYEAAEPEAEEAAEEEGGRDVTDIVSAIAADDVEFLSCLDMVDPEKLGVEELEPDVEEAVEEAVELLPPEIIGALAAHADITMEEAEHVAEALALEDVLDENTAPAAAVFVFHAARAAEAVETPAVLAVQAKLARPKPAAPAAKLARPKPAAPAAKLARPLPPRR